jgi:hypothetical protein
MTRGVDELIDELPNEGESLKWRIGDIPKTKDLVKFPCLRKSFKHSRSIVDPSLMVWLE